MVCSSQLKCKYAWKLFPKFDLQDNSSYFLFFLGSWYILKTLAPDQNRLTFFLYWSWLKSHWFSKAHHGHCQQKQTQIYQVIQFALRNEAEKWGNLWWSNRKRKKKLWWRAWKWKWSQSEKSFLLPTPLSSTLPTHQSKCFFSEERNM